MAAYNKYNYQAVTAAAAARVGSSAKKVLWAIELYPAASNSIVEFKNAATDTGTVLYTLSAPANGPSQYRCFKDIGGIEFDTAMFCKPAGTGAIAYVWYT